LKPGFSRENYHNTPKNRGFKSLYANLKFARVLKMEGFMISLTESAESHILMMMSEGVGTAFALSLNQRGCSGYSYNMKIVRADECENWIKVLAGKVIVLVPEKDYTFLNDSIIDFIKEGFSSRIVVNNPNVDNACGCGASVHFKAKTLLT
jgi:iron-sulfur cluster assembly accessory protein